MSSYWSMPSRTYPAFKRPRLGDAGAAAHMACVDVYMPNPTVTPLEAEIAFSLPTLFLFSLPTLWVPAGHSSEAEEQGERPEGDR